MNEVQSITREYRITDLIASGIPIRGNPNLSEMRYVQRTEFGQRLWQARQHAKLTQAALAKRVSMSQGSYSELEKSGQGSSYTAQLARECGVRIEWLAYGDGEMLPATDMVSLTNGAIELDNNPDFPAIKRVRFKLSAGASGFAVEYLKGEGPPIVFQRSWYEHRGYTPGKLFACKVANGSMEPGLYDGDTVVVNTESSEPKDGLVFAVNYEGEMVIKRLVRDAGQWWLSSDNPDQRRYPRKVCDENVHLIGEIVHKQSERI